MYAMKNISVPGYEIHYDKNGYLVIVDKFDKGVLEISTKTLKEIISTVEEELNAESNYARPKED